MEVTKGLPDLERIVSRIHAKNCRVKDFLKVLEVSYYIPFHISKSWISYLSTGIQEIEQGSRAASGYG